MSVEDAVAVRRSPRVHRAWWVAAVAFVALVASAGFRATSGVLLVPLREEFGWSTATVSLAVSANLLPFGLTAPFAAALMEKSACAGSWRPRSSSSPPAAG